MWRNLSLMSFSTQQKKLHRRKMLQTSQTNSRRWNRSLHKWSSYNFFYSGVWRDGSWKQLLPAVPDLVVHCQPLFWHQVSRAAGDILSEFRWVTELCGNFLTVPSSNFCLWIKCKCKLIYCHSVKLMYCHWVHLIYLQGVKWKQSLIYQLSPVICQLSVKEMDVNLLEPKLHLSPVTCHLSHVTCYLSHVTCNLYIQELDVQLQGPEVHHQTLQVEGNRREEDFIEFLSLDCEGFELDMRHCRLVHPT